MPTPLIEPNVETAVVAAVRRAQISRRRAALLLDAAKRAVEIAIEDPEAAALVWLAAATNAQ